MAATFKVVDDVEPKCQIPLTIIKRYPNLMYCWVKIESASKKFIAFAQPSKTQIDDHIRISQLALLSKNEDEVETATTSFDRTSFEGKITKVSDQELQFSKWAIIQVLGDFEDTQFFKKSIQFSLMKRPVPIHEYFSLRIGQRLIHLKVLDSDVHGDISTSKFILFDKSKSLITLESSNTEKNKIQVNTTQVYEKSLVPALNKLSIKDEEEFPIPKSFESFYRFVCYQKKNYHLMQKLRLTGNKGILMVGPPGVGKTFFIQRLSQKLGMRLMSIRGPELLRPEVGESEAQVKELFSKFRKMIRETGFSVLFMDELDSIAPKHKEGSIKRIVAQLCLELDYLSSEMSDFGYLIVAATNKPENLAGSLKRTGRFDKEIIIDAPMKDERKVILSTLLKKVTKISDDLNIEQLASMTSGYVASDLANFCSEAIQLNVKANIGAGNPKKLSMHDFERAFKTIVPSLRKGKNTMNIRDSGMTWNDVGGLAFEKMKLKRLLEWPTLHAEKLKKFGLSYPKGILLYGPPGCSKTTVVKILASEMSFTFFSLNGASLYSPFVGESEATVRRLFARARAASPSIIFLDELDAIVVNRFQNGNASSAGERILSVLLNEMDGIEEAKNVIVVAATNRPDLIDAAMLRPGRLEQVLYFGPPDCDARYEILRILTKKNKLASDLDLREFSDNDVSMYYTGADLQAVVREAAMNVIRSKRIGENGMLKRSDFLFAFETIKPSISIQMLNQYDEFTERFGGKV